MKKAEYYYELAAVGGDAASRYNLGVFEEQAGNKSMSLQHWMISVGAGHNNSLKAIGQAFQAWHVTNDDMANALRAYKEAIAEMKSDLRDAAAADENFAQHLR